ncbi:GTP-binding protein Rheb like protein, partial [Cyphomyrmex costatus]
LDYASGFIEHSCCFSVCKCYNMPPKQRKIAIMGYRSVGKSSLSIQFVEGQFVDSYDPTIENTFTKSTRVNSQDYELKLVDTAGQDEYSIFPTQYSMDIHGYVLVYSITSAKSFEIVQIIYDKLLDITGKLHVPIVLVGNKTDLYVDRMITTDQGKRLANSWNAAFLETSAKQNESVADIFHTLLKEIEKANGNVQEKPNCIIC